MSRVRLCVMVLLLLAGPEARAVVVAGANGGGNTTNNTTAAQMAAQLGLANTAFLGNILPYSNAGSVYLGWANTVDGPRAYLLSAMHIDISNTMLINAVSYSVTRQSISGSDLALLTLSNVDGIMPPLPVVNFTAATPTIGTGVIMAGFGQNRVQPAATNAFASDAVPVTDGTGYSTTLPQILRWGTNQTARVNAPPDPPLPLALLDLNGRPTVSFTTTFDEPASGEWLSTSEAQAVLGDSGGGVFDTNGNLAGIIVAVSGSDKTDAAFGEASWFADIATYRTAIDTAVGYTLVPEPSTTALFFIGGGTVLFAALRRRR